jgi:hypothetical protein
MAPKREFAPGVHDHQAGSSQRIALAAFLMAPSAPEQEPIYVTIMVAQTFWEAGAPMSWHLIPYRVSVPPIPTTVRARLGEIQPRPALAGPPGGPVVRGEESLLGPLVRGGARRAPPDILRVARGHSEASRGAPHAIVICEQGCPPPRRALHR